MNTLLKIAMGAAIAGAIVAVLAKKSLQRRASPTAGLGRNPPGAQGYTVEELAGEHAEWGGGGSGLRN
jgi:hypothetical protein